MAKETTKKEETNIKDNILGIAFIADEFEDIDFGDFSEQGIYNLSKGNPDFSYFFTLDEISEYINNDEGEMFEGIRIFFVDKTKIEL